jgi:hypothetical protein
MLKSIVKFVERIFEHKTGLEAFIASKHPQNSGDVDHWMRVYQHKEGAWK